MLEAFLNGVKPTIKMKGKEMNEQLERDVDRTEQELATLRSLIAKACHINKHTENELESLITLVNDYETTRSLYAKLSEQLEKENA